MYILNEFIYLTSLSLSPEHKFKEDNAIMSQLAKPVFLTWAQMTLLSLNTYFAVVSLGKLGLGWKFLIIFRSHSRDSVSFFSLYFQPVLPFCSFKWKQFDQEILDKGAKKTQWGKDSFLNKLFWENWITNMQKMKLDPYLILLTKSTSKWIKICVRPKTLKLLEGKHRGKAP